MLLVFDLLELDGVDCRPLPLRERKTRLPGWSIAGLSLLRLLNRQLDEH
jgi:hypothetical protein